MSFSFLWIFSLKVYAFWVASSLCDMPGTLLAAVSQGAIPAVCLGTLLALLECSPVSAAPLWEYTILGYLSSHRSGLLLHFVPYLHTL